MIVITGAGAYPRLVVEGAHAAGVARVDVLAMPGRVSFVDSEAAIIEKFDIYTFDKKTKVYHTSDGLEPLASYWMHAPEPCTIHFQVVGRDTETQP